MHLTPDEIDVELHAAWVWDCPNCGVENFQRAVSVVLKREQAESELRRSGQLEPWEDLPEGEGLQAITKPNGVTCEACDVSYRTAKMADERPDEPEEEDDG